MTPTTLHPHPQTASDRFLLPGSEVGDPIPAWSSFRGPSVAAVSADGASVFVVEIRAAASDGWMVTAASASRDLAIETATETRAAAVRVREWRGAALLSDVDLVASDAVAGRRAALEYRARSSRMVPYAVQLPAGTFEAVVREVGYISPSWNSNEIEVAFLRWSDALTRATRGRLTPEEAHRACVDAENKMFGGDRADLSRRA